MNLNLSMRVIAALAILFGLSGCVGNVKNVGAALDVEVSGKRASGEIWTARADEFSTISAENMRGTDVATVQFKNDIFEWQFFASAIAFGGNITSKRGGPVCFLLARAVLTSNFQATPEPLLITKMQRSLAPVLSSKDELPRAISPKICALPLGGDIGYVASAADFSDATKTINAKAFVITPDLYKIFPSGKMFNVG